MFAASSPALRHGEEVAVRVAAIVAEDARLQIAVVRQPQRGRRRLTVVQRVSLSSPILPLSAVLAEVAGAEEDLHAIGRRVTRPCALMFWYFDVGVVVDRPALDRRRRSESRRC